MVTFKKTKGHQHNIVTFKKQKKEKMSVVHGIFSMPYTIYLGAIGNYASINYSIIEWNNQIN